MRRCCQAPLLLSAAAAEQCCTTCTHAIGQVLWAAYKQTEVRGSCTACLLKLKNDILHACNVGDSGFMVRNLRVLGGPCHAQPAHGPRQLTLHATHCVLHSCIAGVRHVHISGRCHMSRQSCNTCCVPASRASAMHPSQGVPTIIGQLAGGAPDRRHLPVAPPAA